jgi:hypothetical protein
MPLGERGMKSVVAFGGTARAILSLLVLQGVIGVANLRLQGTVPDPLDQQNIIQFLSRAINWYQESALQQQKATTAGDVLFANNGRPTADQVLRLSFEFARAASQVVNYSPASTATLSSLDSRYQGLTKSAANLDAQNTTRPAQNCKPSGKS